MSTTALLNIHPQIQAPLDPEFIPAVLANRNYRAAVAKSGHAVTMAIALERENGLVRRNDLQICAPGSEYDADTLRVVDRHIKFLLWAIGGWKLYLNGPAQICAEIKKRYAPGGTREFDANLMARVYDQPFTLEMVEFSRMPATKETSSTVGGHLEGCRIGFDLGASDYKVSAVIDGNPVFTTEIPWNPVVEQDPQYHYAKILEGLKLAAAHLPRVDAIGGSSAGIYVDNQVKVASLFRSIPIDEFNKVVKPMFLKIQKEWGVPVVVINDGDVTALAGAMSLEQNAMLGIAMGSSEAAGTDYRLSQRTGVCPGGFQRERGPG